MDIIFRSKEYLPSLKVVSININNLRYTVLLTESEEDNLQNLVNIVRTESEEFDLMNAKNLKTMVFSKSMEIPQTNIKILKKTIEQVS